MGVAPKRLAISSALLWPLLIYTKAKTDRIKELYDRELRAIRVEQLLQTSQLGVDLKPITIVIPAFNEEENLKHLLPRIPKSILGKEVATIVIDDASQDRTSEIARRFGATPIRNYINRGQGSASKLGYDILLVFDVEFGVTMDGDNQHRPEDLESLLTPVIKGEKDLVIGSRVLGAAEKVTAARHMEYLHCLS